MILFRRTCRQADASLTILSAPDSVSEGELSAVLFACLPFALYRQGYEYYWKTHAHPNIFRSVRDIVPSKRWLL